MSFKTAAIFYHVNDADRPDEACVGHVARYLNHLNLEVIDYYFTLRDSLPETTNDYDVLFVMGGPGSVYCADRPDWMRHEMSLLENRIIDRKKTIGICLGAQMLAMVAGGHVSKNKAFEFGFHPVNFHHETEHPVLKNIPKSEIFMNWHQDGFIPPKGTVSIASNAASLQETYPCGSVGSQGFVHDDFLGLQFYPEMTLETLKICEPHMSEESSLYQQKGSLVQELAPLYMASERNPNENCAREIFFKLLDNFLGKTHEHLQKTETSSDYSHI